MRQFDIERFKNLARWSLKNDKRNYVKSFLQMLVIFTLLFLFFTTMATVKLNNQNVKYIPCAIVAIAAFAVLIVMGSSYMFYNMDGKHDMQALLMLPASNLEKYLMRYATWILLLPLYLLAFFVADLLQYLVNVLVGHEGTMLVMQYVADNMSIGKILDTSANGNTREVMLNLLMVALWIHSLYALGATFFRWRKYNSILTSVVLVAGYILLTAFCGWGSANCAWWNNHRLFNLLYLVLIVFNFGLSYRLFCRQQVIGKFINW